MSPTVIYKVERIVHATLLRRYKRFLADVRLPDGTETVIHCANTGPMTGLLEHLPAPCILSVSANANRKYAHTLEAIRPPGQDWVGVYSSSANKLARAILERRLVPELASYDTITAEQKLGESRVDFVLEGVSGRAAASTSAAATQRARKTYIEVKSVTLAIENDGSLPQPPPRDASAAERPGQPDKEPEDPPTASAAAPPASLRPYTAVFPDTVSDRASRHMRELEGATRDGHGAACLLVVQRGDCHQFGPAWGYDLAYSQALSAARAAGVHVLPVACALRPRDDGTMDVEFLGPLPLDMDFRRPSEEEERAAAAPKKRKGGAAPRKGGAGKKRAAAAAAVVVAEKEGVAVVGVAVGAVEGKD